MKVLVVSLACFRKNWRQKFVFAAKKEDIIFKIIVPHRWKYSSFPTTFEKDTSPFDIKMGRVAFIGRPGRHFYYTQLAKTILQFRPDIIHIEHEPESIVTLEAIFFSKLFAPRAKILLRTSRTFQSQLRYGKIRDLMERYVYKEVDYIFCVSQKSYNFLRQQGYSGPVKIHPNGVDTNVFHQLDATNLREKLGLKDSRVIGYAGRLLREKGVDVLIKAIAQLKEDYKLLIVGDGPELPHLHEVARKENIDGRLIKIGSVKQEDVPQYINCMDVLVLPSITTDYWEEYFGRVLIEAMACGVPVIGSTCGEIPNVIRERKLIFQEGEIDDLRTKLINLFADYSYWKRWAQKNISRINTDYSWEVLGQQIVDTYNELVR